MQKKSKAEQLGDALREAREAAPQTQGELGRNIANHLGRPEPYGQGYVSSWERGERKMKPEQVIAAERVLGLRPGALTHILGWQPSMSDDVKTVGDAIDADPNLTPQKKRELQAAWEAALAASEATMAAKRKRRPGRPQGS